MQLSISHRLLYFLTSLFALLIFQLAFSTGIFAATETWDGGGGDNNWTTDANWLDDTAPLADDDLVFDTDGYDFSAGNPTNDFVAGTQFNSILVQGATVGAAGTVVIDGNDLDLVAGISAAGGASLTLNTNVTLVGDQAVAPTSAPITLAGDIDLGANTLTVADGSDVALSGVVSGTGGLTTNNSGTLTLSGVNTFDGAVAINAGTLNMSDASALGSVLAGTVVADGATLMFSFLSTPDVTVSEDITFEGVGDTVAALYLGPAGSGGTTIPSNGDLTLDGTVTLAADGTFYADSYNFTNSIVDFQDFVAGGNTLTLVDGSGSEVIVNTVTQAAASALTTTVADTLPGTSMVVNPNSVLVVNGSRGDIDVLVGGVLMGAGTVGNIGVYGGILTTGTSPGCLNTGDLSLSAASTFLAEIEGTTACTNYDQAIVTGTVDLGSSTLSIAVGGGFTPANGNEFVIINNDGADAITGTFNGLTEGATVFSGGVDFIVSYVGGDGNDVTLTASVADTTTPTAPNTGLGLTSTYMLTAIITMMLSGSLYSYAYIRNSRRG